MHAIAKRCGARLISTLMTTDSSQIRVALDIASSTGRDSARRRPAHEKAIGVPRELGEPLKTRDIGFDADAAADTASTETLAHRLARLVLTAFVLTFVASRLCVFLMMSRFVPDVVLRCGDTHIHHLCYGIILLSFIAGYAVIIRPGGRAQSLMAALYGVGLGLTFDEFGLWINLGGSYWQRASVVAVFGVGAALAVIAYLPLFRGMRRGHWVVAGVILAGLIGAGALIERAVREDTIQLSELLHQVERTGPL